MVHKKKLHVFLFILLVTLLLGSFSNCYAYDELITSSNIKSMVDYLLTNLVSNNKITESQASFLLNQPASSYDSVSTYFNNNVGGGGMSSLFIIYNQYAFGTYISIFGSTGWVGDIEDLPNVGQPRLAGYFNNTFYNSVFGAGNNDSWTNNKNIYRCNIPINTFSPQYNTLTSYDNWYDTMFITSNEDLNQYNILNSTFGMFWDNLASVYTYNYQDGAKNIYYIRSIFGNYKESLPVPEEPSGDLGGSTGTITNPSGEVTGQIDLSGIEQGIIGIKNTITEVPSLSGETISSGDIVDALGFDFMADPYDNFWLQMITGLSGALTNTVRKIPVNWLGFNGFFDLDELGFNYPEPIRNILTTVSTVTMIWVLVKWWKIIVDKLSSGDIDEVLAMNEEERYRGLILGGVKC